MDSATVNWLFAINDNVFQVNCEGVTHADSLIRPEAGGNCFNWITGHLIGSRRAILGFLGHDWTLPDGFRDVYGRGASGADIELFLSFDQLRELWQESQGLLSTAIETQTAESWLENVTWEPPFDKPEIREKRVHFFHFHESYHLGQLGLLRRLIGKDGAIR